MNAIPGTREIERHSRLGRDSPIRVCASDSKAERTADIKPEMLSEFTSDGCDGHGCGRREMSD